MPRIGVVSVQGAFTEHRDALQAAVGYAEGTEDVEVVDVRRPQEASTCHGFVLPGGESTTMSKLLDSSGVRDVLRARVEAGAAVLGTCAGAILLAAKGDAQVERTGTRLMGLVDIAVERNAYGRQVDSFETDLRVEGDDRPFPGVFIRAPAIVDHWGEARPLVRRSGEVVGVEQGRRMALTFHPELGGDPRLHARFLGHAAGFEDQT